MEPRHQLTAVDTAKLTQYCRGPLWIDQTGSEELSSSLACVASLAEAHQPTRGAAEPASAQARTLVVTPELLAEPAKQEPKQLQTLQVGLHREYRRERTAALEYVWSGETQIVERNIHGFIDAIKTAWSEHLPLVLKPEHIWLLILQGISALVNADPEGLRDRFVDFDGEEELRIIRDDFVKGSKTNDWGGAIDEFGELLDKNIKLEARAVFGVQFSTSTRSEGLCARLTAMATCKHYFRYVVSTMCGFPTVTLLGSLEDWQRLRTEAESAIGSLCEASVASRWQSALLPVLDNFVEAYQGNVDGVFWNSMLKRGFERISYDYHAGFSGWFNVFFPRTNMGANRFCEPFRHGADYVVAGLSEGSKGKGKGKEGFSVQSEDVYPSGMDTVPMTWEYYGLTFPMEFVSGFMGYTQDPKTRAVMPVMSWYLLDKTPSVTFHMVEEQLAASGRKVGKRDNGEKGATKFPEAKPFVEKRIANDGLAYTFAEFAAWYPNSFMSRWTQAKQLAKTDGD